MPSIQEEVSSDVLDLLVKFLGSGSEFLYSMVGSTASLVRASTDFNKEMLATAINAIQKKDRKSSKDRDELSILSSMKKKVEKGDTLNNILVADEEVGELKRYFDKQGISYFVADNVKDDTNIFFYLNSDSQKARDAVALWQADKGLISELDPILFLDNLATSSIGTVLNVSDCDLELFRKQAVKEKLVFASCRISENQNMIIYNPEDKKELNSTLSSVAFAGAGEQGALIREQLEYKFKNRQAINIDMLDGEREFYVANGQNPQNYVHITANDFKYYKNSKEVLSVSRSSSGFMERAMQVINGLNPPIELSKEEFELVKPDGEADIEAIKAVVTAKAAQFISDDRLEDLLEEQNTKRELIELKMGLDDESQSSFWLFDDSISYSVGSGFEEIDDDNDALFTKEAKEKAKSFEIKEVSSDRRNIDVLIAEAKSKQKNYNEKQRDDEIYL